jgi:hypothetical protein
LTLERGLIAGVVLLLAGMCLNIWLVSHWVSQNLGHLEVQSTLRCAIWGLTTMVLGLQTIYTSFFLSMLGMARDKRLEAEKRR